ncbi:MAG: Mu transposase C-terminal domain-containing protein [Candidatus Gastranaerophilales bacterium]|nr:Mu transposase C-terminal domain-containing protein [Candidatus Gastranaerophilales bacterium]
MDINFTPEKSKQIALARLDLIHQWQEFRRKSTNKLSADYDFVKLHNSSNSYLFEILGKISRGSLHRWNNLLNGSEDYTLLLPQYKYSCIVEYRTVLTDEEIRIFMGLLLHPNRLSIGKATALTKYKLKQQGQNFIPADITFRRYAKWFKDNNYDKWILARDGEKALSDKVEPYIKRDASLLEVGDILVADGHKLAFQVINPFTGKPKMATLVGFLDWKSTALVGYEIMLEENTQCIASALRNSIINLDMIPKVVYQDNGRAFRAKYFTDDKGFSELGFNGLYSKLGIETVFARPYNARAKVIERFFKEFQEGFEKLLPSYVGSAISEKPAYLKRNERFHANLHSEYVPTIEEADFGKCGVERSERARPAAVNGGMKHFAKQNCGMKSEFTKLPTIQDTIKIIDMWLSFKNSQPCPNSPDKMIAEVLEDRKRQNINTDTLDDLMLATEVKTIQRNGIRFLNYDYFDERLYGFKNKVRIKYNLFDLTSIKVFTIKGEYLCKAERVTETHPMAKILGDVKDLEDYKQKIEKQRKLRKKTINSVKELLSNDECKFIETKIIKNEEFLTPVKTSFKSSLNGVYKNNSEKYEYLVKNNPQDKWIEEFKQTKEYKLLYD